MTDAERDGLLLVFAETLMFMSSEILRDPGALDYVRGALGNFIHRETEKRARPHGKD